MSENSAVSNLRHQAEQGLLLIKVAVVELIRASGNGLTNAKLAKALGLQSDYEGRHHGNLSWSILGLLLKEGKIEKMGKGQSARYVIAHSSQPIEIGGL